MSERVVRMIGVCLGIAMILWGVAAFTGQLQLRWWWSVALFGVAAWNFWSAWWWHRGVNSRRS